MFYAAAARGREMGWWEGWIGGGERGDDEMAAAAVEEDGRRCGRRPERCVCFSLF